VEARRSYGRASKRVHRSMDEGRSLKEVGPTFNGSSRLLGKDTQRIKLRQ